MSKLRGIKKEKIEDLSAIVLCEFKTNIFFRENKDNSLYQLKNILKNMREGNIVENIDIINFEK